MYHTFKRHGLNMVQTWIKYGPNMEHTRKDQTCIIGPMNHTQKTWTKEWTKYETNMEYTWTKLGPNLDHHPFKRPWTKIGPTMSQTRTKPALSLDQWIILSKAMDQKMDQVWIKHGPNLEHKWTFASIIMYQPLIKKRF